MALNADQWQRVQDAVAAIRAEGCVACVFAPDDVESMVAESDEDHPTAITDVEAVEFLDRNRRNIEDRMCEAGNMSIETLLSMDGLI